MASKRSCRQPGCSAIVASGYCPQHTKAVYDPQYERQRGTSTERGYDTNWRRVRRRHLSIEPLCRECGKMGRLTVAEEVDHITPIRSGGERLEHANLQSLCKSCHSRKTIMENWHKGHVKSDAGTPIH